ncbi:MAG: pyridoxamine 5'-phosphate oxidase family protein [Sphingomonas bacterium]|nr:pyridoxamine 5'-phosphate oxidase family protein [Sphingomonas bacterium]
MTDPKPAWTIDDIAEKMRDLDFCLLSTKAADGTLPARPMSNNRNVEYDGNSWFFADDSARMVEEIAANPNVGLGFQGKAGMLGMRPLFIAIEGKAELIRDEAQFDKHWTKGLERWWPEGTDTPGLVLIKVQAVRAHYWDGEEEGEATL